MSTYVYRHTRDVQSPVVDWTILGNNTKSDREGRGGVCRVRAAMDRAERGRGVPPRTTPLLRVLLFVGSYAATHPRTFAYINRPVTPTLHRHPRTPHTRAMAPHVL